MTSEPTVPKESALVEVTPETKALVQEQMAGESDEIKQKTMELVEAIKKRAQSEIQGASQLSRDAYLNAVEQARASIEENKLIDRDRIEYTMKLIQMDAEKNWNSILSEISQLGDRLTEAAKAAWDVLTAPKPSDPPNSDV